MNRPDVMVHGRYVHQTAGPVTERHVTTGDFHAGTRKAAHDRLSGSVSGIGVPWEGHVAKFFYGRVDPAKMKNTSDAAFDGDPGGRLKDQQEEWEPRHFNHYYRNDYEDPGSTSAILRVRDHRGTPVREAKETVPWPDKKWTGSKWEDTMGTITRTANLPENFHSWRDSVGSALYRGQHVPAHVEALYHATGGSAGRHSVHDTEFKTPHEGDAEDADVPMLKRARYGWIPDKQLTD